MERKADGHVDIIAIIIAATEARNTNIMISGIEEKKKKKEKKVKS